MGLLSPSAILATSVAIASISVMDWGVRITKTPATSGSSKAAWMAARYRSDRASPITSTGLWIFAVAGSAFFRMLVVLSENFANFKPVVIAASVVRTPGPPALVMMATFSDSGY